MIPIGYEYGFRKKLDVVNTRPEDWEKPAFDLTTYIGEVNRMKASLPVLNEEGPQRSIVFGDGRVVGLLRRALRGSAWSLLVVNTDRGAWATVKLDPLDADVGDGREMTPGGKDEPFRSGAEVTLEPGEVRLYASA